ncbi:spore germination lipoprotein GerD [Cohnella candidum]|uniref:Spore gernimation protein n=1 Tax=Cohnella candidum TaxID=2674991 RepID=A0A3G3K0H0_9BACL|nr:spore germination lipoprotein GerD [Cohnella candidum]AYQ74015.1 spore gernimation protein [Cohnella candidum]
MLRRLRFAGAAAALMLVLASCGQESSDSGGGQMSYKEVKSMVIDILGSEEAQKAIVKASSSTAEGGSTLLMKGMTAQDHEQVKLAVKDVLTSPDYSRVIETIMKDPKFAGEFAKAVSKDNKQIHKDLMKDPGYQKDMIDMLKNPEAQRVLSDSMKTTEFRKQMMAGVTEAIQNPLFKLEIMKMLQTVVKDELTPKEASSQGGQQSKGEGQGGQSGGSSGESGSGGGGSSGG